MEENTFLVMDVKSAFTEYRGESEEFATIILRTKALGEKIVELEVDGETIILRKSQVEEVLSVLQEYLEDPSLTGMYMTKYEVENFLRLQNLAKATATEVIANLCNKIPRHMPFDSTESVAIAEIDEGDITCVYYPNPCGRDHSDKEFHEYPTSILTEEGSKVYIDSEGTVSLEMLEAQKEIDRIKEEQEYQEYLRLKEKFKDKDNE